jgi:hypothetical protein
MQPRFNSFQEKVVHLVLDDAAAFVDPDPKAIFALEDLQEKARWESFLRWNEHTAFFGPEDLVGFGDADEIASRENVNLLRNCEMIGHSVDIGSWFAWTRLDKAFRSDWPVHQAQTWTLGDPTYWTVASATEYSRKGDRYPTRMRGTSGYYLLGGIHMTDNGLLPFLLAKLIACSDCADDIAKISKVLAPYFQQGKGNISRKGSSILDLTEKMDRSLSLRDRFERVEDVKMDLGSAYYLPWYLKCNPERFPSWYGRMDSRIA